MTAGRRRPSAVEGQRAGEVHQRSQPGERACDLGERTRHLYPAAVLPGSLGTHSQTITRRLPASTPMSHLAARHAERAHKNTMRERSRGCGRERDTGARISKALEGQSRAADSVSPSGLRFATSVARAHEEVSHEGERASRLDRHPSRCATAVRRPSPAL